ncbi:hypothetical protein KCU95_g5123, partial [Aureobasidium melanogenum]
MGPLTSFSFLPPEIITKICRDSTLKKEDLISLRLTSKSHGIHLSASKEFAKRYLTEINLVFTRYSLQAFLEICKHHVYGPAVRKIQLSYARFKPNCFEEESTGLFDRIETHEQSRSDIRNEYLERIRLLVKRCDEEEDLKTSCDAEGLLAAAFAALSKWRHPLKISVSSTEDGALGRSQIYSLSDLIDEVSGVDSHWECDILGTVKLLYHAAIRGTCAVQALQIGGDVCGKLIDSSSESLSSLAQLSDLELDIRPSKVTSLDGMVTELLEHAVHLKTLRLADHDDWEEDPQYLPKTFSIVSRMKLEKMTLTWMDLDRFNPFENQNEYLRHLELINCATETRLKDVLLSIRKKLPQLEYLRFSGVRQMQDAEFQGVEGVKDGIDELMQSRLKHHNNPGMAVPWDSDEE